MKIGILSDLHIDYGVDRRFAESKNRAVESVLHEVDCLVMCGDNAEPDYDIINQRELFETIRSKSNIPVSFITGNHDLMGSVLRVGLNIDDIRYNFNKYSKLAREYNIIHLEKQNLVLKDTIVCGTYGHYDGTLSGVKFEEDNKVVSELIKDLENRVLRADKTKRKILVTHTLPSRSLIGHPKGPKQDKFNPFAGSIKLRNTICKIKPYLHFCGHTHAYAHSRICETKSFNVGTNYNNFFYFVVDTSDFSVTRLEKQLDIL